MPREIKFRVWDKQKKQMREVREIYFDGHGGVDVYCSGDDINARPLGADSLIEYTGLKDKRGQEIWEGDIFASETGNWEVKNGNWNYWSAGTSLTPMCGFYATRKEGENTSERTLLVEHIKVIGNIYENPELLTK